MFVLWIVFMKVKICWLFILMNVLTVEYVSRNALLTQFSQMETKELKHG